MRVIMNHRRSRPPCFPGAALAGALVVAHGCAGGGRESSGTDATASGVTDPGESGGESTGTTEPEPTSGTNAATSGGTTAETTAETTVDSATVRLMPDTTRDATCPASPTGTA